MKRNLASQLGYTDEQLKATGESAEFRDLMRMVTEDLTGEHRLPPGPITLAVTGEDSYTREDITHRHDVIRCMAQRYLDVTGLHAVVTENGTVLYDGPAEELTAKILAD